MTDREVLIALSNPVEGKDAEFRTWYWDTHIAEVLTVPGFLSAKMFRLEGDATPTAPFRYATIYEIEGSAQQAQHRLYTAGLDSSDTMSFDPMIMAPFIPRDA